MIDWLKRILGGGTMTDDLDARVARAEEESGQVNRRVDLVERRMDTVEEALRVRRERYEGGRGASA